MNDEPPKIFNTHLMRSFVIVDFFNGSTKQLEQYLKDHNLPHALVGDERSFDDFLSILECDNKLRKE